MNRTQTEKGVALLALTITICAAAASSNAADGVRDLRQRMAGAWRGDQHSDVLHIDGDLCVTALGSRQAIFTMQYQGDVARRTLAFSGMAMPGELTLRDGKLVMRVPSQGIEVTYSRMDTVPDSVRLDPYKLGTRTPNGEELAAIRKEIARRTKREQSVRMKSIEAARDHDDQSTLQAMISIDRANTLRIIDLVQDVGWLDKVRFGKKTQQGAFLIVQHSGNLRLMRTVLPLIEQEAKADPALGQLYALLSDRLQMSLGKKQRYGTQAAHDPNGGMTIERLEDRTRVDDWRREMGMQPLADYMQTLGEVHGTEVSIGD